jgi:hypothetical protein
VSFADGFCFAARKHFLARVCPIDLDINPLGWGPDTHLGYLAIIYGGCVVVDDRIVVFHPEGTGYDERQAALQYREWRSRFAVPARFFHVYGRRERLLQGFGYRLLALATTALWRLCGRP